MTSSDVCRRQTNVTLTDWKIKVKEAERISRLMLGISYSVKKSCIVGEVFDFVFFYRNV